MSFSKSNEVKEYFHIVCGLWTVDAAVLTCLNVEACSGSRDAAKAAVSAKKTLTAANRVSLSKYFFFKTKRTIFGSAS